MIRSHPRPSFHVLSAAVALLGLVSCTTSYDAYGRPQQSVDPGAAALGAVAAGVVGYAIADNRNDRRANRYHRPPSYRPSPYRPPHHGHGHYRPRYGRY